MCIETYDIARKKEKEAEVISTSDEASLRQLSCTSPIQQQIKRQIKKPQFHDEIEEAKNNSMLLYLYSYNRQLQHASNIAVIL